MAKKPRKNNRNIELDAGTTKLPETRGDSADFWFTEDPFDARRTEKATPRSIQKIATAYACVDVYGKTMGMLPASVYRPKAGGGKEAVNNHPLFKVLRRPNPLMDRFQFWQLKERTQILTGNFYAQKIYNRLKELVALHPIHPDRVTVCEVKGSYDIEYEIDTPNGKQTLQREEMFHTKEPGEDGVVGRSRIKIAYQSFELALAYQNHNQALVENDSRPMGLLSPSGPIKGDENKEKLRSSWEEAHKGPRKSGRVAVLPFGVEYKAISMTARDAQLLELMTFQGVDAVNTIFDVPPYRTQDFRRATFSNVEQADLFWHKNSISPRAASTECAIEQQLLTDEEREHLFVRFNLDALLRADIKTRYDSYHVAIADGWLSRQEVRALEDWDPVSEEEGLSLFLVPSNLTTARSLKQALDAPKEDPSPAAADEPSSAEEEGQSNAGEANKSESTDEALSALLRDPISRLISKEKRAIRKCLKKDSWVKESEVFYEKHRRHMKDALHSALSAFYGVVGEPIEESELEKRVERAVLKHLEVRANGIADALRDGGRDSLPDAVDRWDAPQALEQALTLITEEVINHVGQN